MSIYFQFPAINDYPNFVYSAVPLDINAKNIEDEDNLNEKEIKELKDYFALKPI